MADSSLKTRGVILIAISQTDKHRLITTLDHCPYALSQ